MSLTPVAIPASWAGEVPARPLVIGHRGAAGYMPEHTITSYRHAIEQGADYIDVDLVRTKDGWLIALHENELSATTNIAEYFPERKTKKVIDGKLVEGWFTEDFTLDELNILRTFQVFPFRDQSENGKNNIPTLAEILALRSSASRELGRPIGVSIELRHPGYFRSIGQPMEYLLHTIMKAWALDREGAPVYLRASELDSLRRMRETSAAPVVFKIDPNGADTSDARLTEIAAVANGIIAVKTLIIPIARGGALAPPTDLVQRAHRAGLFVHTYTLGPEQAFLPPGHKGDAAREYCDFARAGVDAILTDTPDLALKAFAESCPMAAPLR